MKQKKNIPMGQITKKSRNNFCITRVKSVLLLVGNGYSTNSLKSVLYSCLLGQITLLRFMESCSTWAEVNEEKIEKEKTKVAVNWVVYNVLMGHFHETRKHRGDGWRRPGFILA